MPPPATGRNIPLMATLNEQIEDVASAPKRMTNDAGSVEEHDLGQLIEADKYLRAKDAATRPIRAVGYGKFIPPGTR